MPKLPSPKVELRPWPHDREKLLERGARMAAWFCNENVLEVPSITSVDRADWHFAACAYYRPDGIKICLHHCGCPCGEEQSRNWTWPASTTDREPYGVIAHELGHHLDYLVSESKGNYGGNFSINLRKITKEPPLTSYCDNDWEWFAEIARLFITNHALLALLRPKTHAILVKKFKPISGDDWRAPLGSNCPDRVLKSVCNKIKAATGQKILL